MPTIGFHASHEQFAPGELKALVRRAEQAGFPAAMGSDHFMPWTEAQGHSGYAWTWLGATLEATRLPMGVVTVPGYRYHPAVLAQKIATVGSMYPGRFWVALGSGERLNEHVTGEAWPPKRGRNARLHECFDVMRALLRGDTVEHRGRIVVESAKLYTLPETTPPLYGAAITPETAREIAPWCDGLLTVAQPIAKLRRVVAAFREGGGEAKPMLVQAKVSYDVDDERARLGALEQWKGVMFDSHVLAELRMPQEFEAAAKFVRAEDVDHSVLVSSDLAKHVDHLAEIASLGFRAIYVHNVNREQERFVDAYGEHVLPRIARH